jgi:hypothetical protein
MNAVIKSGLAILFVAATAGVSSSAQTPRLHRVMRDKLEHSQKILEAVVTSNWDQLDREGRALARASQDPAWSVLKMPEYVRYSQAFLRATDDLIEAAKLRDLEAASLGFISLSTSCVSCHRYIARARTVTASLDPAPMCGWSELRAAVQHVVEPTVQPRLAGCIVVPGVNRFVVDVRKVATQAGDLLHQAALSLRHELPIAPIPQLVTVGDRPGNAAAVGSNRVLRCRFRLERRQLPMPVHDL